jgi:hypothetical protein
MVSYGRGTNPSGGGNIVVSPESEEDVVFLTRLYHPDYLEPPPPAVQRWFHQAGFTSAPLYSVGQEVRIECRTVRHNPNPHDGGLDPRFVAIVRRFGWAIKAYPELAIKG